MSDPVIYDWPLTITPSAQVFHAPGQVFQGGFTGGGAETISPDPGGRAFLEMAFNTLPSDGDSRLASWLFTKVANGALFRVPLYRSIQLVRDQDLPVVPPEFVADGLPWHDDAGGDLWWDGDFGWGLDSSVLVLTGALEGQTQFTIDMGVLGRVLFQGHVIGYDSRAYMVDSIIYDDDDVATVTVTPPMRTDFEPGEPVTFRPTMIGRVTNPESFKAMFELGKWVKPGAVIFAESIV